MNTMTARALMVGVLIAIWAWLASVARLNVSMWAGVVALGCLYASGGGVAGLQKTIVATLSGVVGAHRRGRPRRDRRPRRRLGGDPRRDGMRARAAVARAALVLHRRGVRRRRSRARPRRQHRARGDSYRRRARGRCRGPLRGRAPG